MINKTSSEEPVDFKTIHRSTGQHQENSLYHLLDSPNERRRLSTQQGLQIISSNHPHRKAWFIRIPALESSPGSTLIYPNCKVSTHLSIDCDVLKNHPSLLPNHFTEEYSDATHKWSVHVYFDTHGEFAHVQIKESLLFGEGPHLKKNIDIDLTVEQRCRDRAKPYQARLKTLIADKNERYLDIYKETITLSDDLERLLSASEPSCVQLTVIEKIYEDYKEKIRLVGLYHETIKRDGRAFFLDLIEHLILKYKHALALSQNTLQQKAHSSPGEPSFPLTLAESKTTIKNKKKGAKRQNQSKQKLLLEKEQASNAELFAKAAQHIDSACEQEIPDLVEHYFKLLKLEEELLFVEIGSSCTAIIKTSEQYRAGIKKLIQAQAQLFKQQLAAGVIDIKTVESLFEYMECQISLNQTYFDLLEGILQNKGATDSNLIQVLQFIHQHSVIYQAVFRLRAEYVEVSTANKIDVSLGVLAKLIYKDNLSGFKMYLQQGMSPRALQIGFNQYYYEALYVVITRYSMTGHDNFSLFADLLFEYGATLHHATNVLITSKNSFQIAQAQQKAGIQARVVEFDFSRTTAQPCFVFKNYIQFARQILSDMPDRLAAMLCYLGRYAKAEDLSTLFDEYAYFLYQHFDERLCVTPEPNVSMIFDHSLRLSEMPAVSKTAALPDHVSPHVVDSAIQSTSSEFLSLIFQFISHARPHAELLYTIAHTYLNMIHSVLQDLKLEKLEKLRTLQRHLTENAELKAQSLDAKVDAYVLFQSAILVSILKGNPEDDDQNSVILLLVQFIKLCQTEPYYVGKANALIALLERYFDPNRQMLSSRQKEIYKTWSGYKAYTDLNLFSPQKRDMSATPEDMPYAENSNARV